MRRHWRHRLANIVLPRPLPIIDQLNYNARVTGWIKAHPRLPVLPDRSALYRFIQQEVIKGEAMDFLEFGVYEGDSIREWAALNVHRDSRFYGFDSFSGLPEDWGRCKADRFDMKGVIPIIHDSRVEFIAGWFQDTLPSFLATFTPARRIIINNDSDLYSSTLYCLTQLDAKLPKGTVIIFDEYYSAIHEFRALADYCAAYHRQVTPLARVDDEHGRVAFILG